MRPGLCGRGEGITPPGRLAIQDSGVATTFLHGDELVYALVLIVYGSGEPPRYRALVAGDTEPTQPAARIR
jgi:hypothetical protein